MELPEKANQFRPINLCNVVVKLLSKLMVTRLRPLLKDLVSPTQGAFIPGRGCHDNEIVVQEVLHSMKKSKGVKGKFFMKVDLEKAYDKVNCGFLRWVLQDFGLPDSWISQIMFSVTQTRFTLLWNGEKLEPFIPKQGLQQGDPLSPYLFVICLEKLSQIIDVAVEAKVWKPFRITRRGPSLSHLFFADDLVFVGEAMKENASVIVTCLESFCSMLGQVISIPKSKLYFSSNTHANTADSICHISGMQATNELEKYLGLPLHTKRVSKSLFSDLISKVQAKLSPWKTKNLSLAGRQVLIQSVTSTIATHTMQTVQLPASVKKDIDKLNRGFLW